MIRLRIRGMTCDHCVRAVAKALEGVEGVEKVVEVHLGRGEARVEGRADPSSLVSAVRDEGYEAEVVSS